MEEYQDEKESTETCFKLECHHAFHTKCIMECLLKSKSACPLCNKDKERKGVCLTVKASVWVNGWEIQKF